MMTDEHNKSPDQPSSREKTEAQARAKRVSVLLDSQQNKLDDKIATVRAVGAVDKARLGSALKMMMGATPKDKS
ncbi:MAG: hypothetical protein HOK46_07395 [Alphaproteobacteria bacterium]|nr:hypothetical protein [Alphaproteobacteria bacterium]